MHISSEDMASGLLSSAKKHWEIVTTVMLQTLRT